MKYLLTLLALVVAATAWAQNWPYNPDSNDDSIIGADDLLSLLSFYGGDFNAAEINVQTVNPDSLIREFWYTPSYWDDCVLGVVDGLYKCTIQIEGDTDLLYIDFEKEEYYGTEFTIVLPQGEEEKSLVILAVPPDLVITHGYSGYSTYWESDCQLSFAIHNNSKFTIIDDGDTEPNGMVDFDVNGMLVSVYQNNNRYAESLGTFISSPSYPKEPIIAEFFRLNGRWTRLDK